MIIHPLEQALLHKMRWRIYISQLLSGLILSIYCCLHLTWVDCGPTYCEDPLDEICGNSSYFRHDSLLGYNETCLGQFVYDARLDLYQDIIKAVFPFTLVGPLVKFYKYCIVCLNGDNELRTIKNQIINVSLMTTIFLGFYTYSLIIYILILYDKVRSDECNCSDATTQCVGFLVYYPLVNIFTLLGLHGNKDTIAENKTSIYNRAMRTVVL